MRDSRDLGASSGDVNLRNGLPVCGAQRSGRSSSGPGICQNYAGYGTDHKGFGRCKFHGGATPNHTTSAVAAAVAARSGGYGEPISIDPMAALLGEVNRTSGHVAWLAADLQRHSDPAEFETRILRKLYSDERAHLVRVAKAAVDAGFAEREVFLAEEQGRVLVQVIQAVMGALDLTPRQRLDARRVVAEELRRVSALEVGSG
jgi:hypothetical protein